MERRNNYDLLRLLFALTVFFVHAYTLSNKPQLKILLTFFNSQIAVDGFFVISGFLIIMSYEKSDTLKSYFIKRAKRIGPAYFCVVLLSAVMGLFLTVLPLTSYFNTEVLNYLIANLSFLNFFHPDLPGVFTTNTVNTINGALWTIKIEICFYLIVPLLVFIQKKVNRPLLLIMLYIAGFLWYHAFSIFAVLSNRHFFDEIARQLPGQLSYFITGMLCYYYFDTFKQYSNFIFVLALLLLFLANFNLNHILFPLALGLLVIYFGSFFRYLGNIGKYGDLSYGVYLFHFPIIQIYVHFQFFKYYPWIALFCSSITVLLMTFLSWHFIEKRFLERKSYYLQNSEFNASPENLMQEQPSFYDLIKSFMILYGLIKKYRKFLT